MILLGAWVQKRNTIYLSVIPFKKITESCDIMMAPKGNPKWDVVVVVVVGLFTALRIPHLQLKNCFKVRSPCLSSSSSSSCYLNDNNNSEEHSLFSRPNARKINNQETIFLLIVVAGFVNSQQTRGQNFSSSMER